MSAIRHRFVLLLDRPPTPSFAPPLWFCPFPLQSLMHKRQSPISSSECLEIVKMVAFRIWNAEIPLLHMVGYPFEVAISSREREENMPESAIRRRFVPDLIGKLMTSISAGKIGRWRRVPPKRLTAISDSPGFETSTHQSPVGFVRNPTIYGGEQRRNCPESAIRP
jgi:hypothetical protein